MQWGWGVTPAIYHKNSVPSCVGDDTDVSAMKVDMAAAPSCEVLAGTNASDIIEAQEQARADAEAAAAAKEKAARKTAKAEKLLNLAKGAMDSGDVAKAKDALAQQEQLKQSIAEPWKWINECPEDKFGRLHNSAMLNQIEASYVATALACSSE